MHIFAHFTLQHMNERDIVSNVRRNVAGHTNEGDKATHVSMNNACKYSLDKSTPLKRFQSLLLLLDIAFITLVPFTLASKNPNLSRIRVFFESCYQIPLNTPKNPNRKTHLAQRDFHETPPKFHCLVVRNVRSQATVHPIIAMYYS